MAPRAPSLVVKPDTRHVPTEDEFAAWAEHPTTRYIAAAWLAGAEAQKRAWVDLSWGPEALDPQQTEFERQRLITRADAYMAFLETGLNDYAAILAQENR